MCFGPSSSDGLGRLLLFLSSPKNHLIFYQDYLTLGEHKED